MDNNKLTVNISAPWFTYYRKLNALFGKDPDVERIVFDEDDMVIRIFVVGQDKADAISKILPESVSFGNVTVNITVIPANKAGTKFNTLCTAFKGNPAFSFGIEIPMEVTQSNPLSYFAFSHEVVQFFNDNLHDPNGNVTTLYEDIAREVIGESDGICFCTDKPGNPGPNG